MEKKFIIHEAILYENKIGRVEDTAIDANGNNIYLIQFPNHMYRWVKEEYLERYIG